MVMRMSLDQINTLGRVTQGVRLIKLKDEQQVATISIVDKEKEESNQDEIEETDNQSINTEVINNDEVTELGNNENDIDGLDENISSDDEADDVESETEEDI